MANGTNIMAAASQSAILLNTKLYAKRLPQCLLVSFKAPPIRAQSDQFVVVARPHGVYSKNRLFGPICGVPWSALQHWISAQQD